MVCIFDLRDNGIDFPCENIMFTLIPRLNAPFITSAIIVGVMYDMQNTCMHIYNKGLDFVWLFMDEMITSA